MAKFDFDKPVASFSWYLQNGSADDKRGNRLHVGTGQNAQIYFDPESGEFIGKLKYVDDYIDRGRCTARAGEEIHRETEGGLADGTRIQIPNLPE